MVGFVCCFLLKLSHEMLGLRKVILAMFTGVMLKKINPNTFLLVFVHDNLWSISLEFGCDIYLFIYCDNAALISTIYEY